MPQIGALHVQPVHRVDSALEVAAFVQQVRMADVPLDTAIELGGGMVAALVATVDEVAAEGGGVCRGGGRGKAGCEEVMAGVAVFF